MPDLIRINKFLAQRGIASRRKSDELISQGRVCLNGIKLSSPGAMVDPVKDTVSVDGVKIDAGLLPEHLTYLMLNKPAGYITTLKDTHKRRTVMDLVPGVKGVFPVGRLDKDTTGLLIMTNDGRLCHRLMHPSFEMDRLYEVTIAGQVKASDISRIERGVDIGDGKASALKVLDIINDKFKTVVRVSLHEGRKRQVRKTFEALGYKIKELTRTGYAGLKLDLQTGSYRHLSEKEVSLLKKGVGIT
ncbi:MAG: pseudouridine synthase [Candidatus Omnitrophica bacterium]|nr:pseudouridine synthase [Candidatus Omnitrophota bacterium]